MQDEASAPFTVSLHPRRGRGPSWADKPPAVRRRARIFNSGPFAAFSALAAGGHPPVLHKIPRLVRPRLRLTLSASLTPAPDHVPACSPTRLASAPPSQCLRRSPLPALAQRARARARRSSTPQARSQSTPARQTAMRVRKSEDPADDPSKLPFQLGELVLCRYSSYPYWPAVVDVTHQKKQKGRYVKWSRKFPPAGGRVLVFWCTFSNEDSGGWVRSDRMVRFHPELVKLITVPTDHEDYDAQSDAVAAARRDYDAIYGSKGPQPVPEIPSDLKDRRPEEYSDAGEESDDEEDNAAGTDRDEEEKGPSRKSEPVPRRRNVLSTLTATRRKKSEPTPPSRPRAKKEPRKTVKRKSAPTTPPRAKKKPKTTTPQSAPPKTERRRSAAKKEPVAAPDPRDEMDVDDDDAEDVVMRARKTPRTRDDHAADSAKVAELERSLEAANSTISKLKRSLRKKENQIAELTDGSSPVHVKSPPAPDVTELPMPPKTRYRSAPMDGEEFSNVIAGLRRQYDSFTESVRTASGVRLKLETETKAVQEKVGKLVDEVVSAEKTAAENESALAGMLRKILVADVAVADLRAHKAGNLLKAMTKKCKEMQLIFDYSSAIYETWMQQVMKHVGENEKPKSEASEEKKTKSEERSGKTETEARTGNGPRSSEKGETSAGADSSKEVDGTAKDSKNDADQGKGKPPSKKSEKTDDDDDDVEMKDVAEDKKSIEQKEDTREPTKEKETGDAVADDERRPGDKAEKKGRGSKEKAAKAADAHKSNDEESNGTGKRKDASDAKREETGEAAQSGTGDAIKDKDARSSETSKDDAHKSRGVEASAKAGKKVASKDGKESKTDLSEKARGDNTSKMPAADGQLEPKETPTSVTLPADGHTGKSTAQPVGGSKAGSSEKAVTASNVQKDASGKSASENDGRTNTSAPEQKLPPSAGGKEAATS